MPAPGLVRLNQPVNHTPLARRDVDQVEAMTNVEANKIGTRKDLGMAHASGGIRCRLGRRRRDGSPRRRSSLLDRGAPGLFTSTLPSPIERTLTYICLARTRLYSAVIYRQAADAARSHRRRALDRCAAAHRAVSLATARTVCSSFYFFDILVASFRRGAAEGHRVTIAATLLLTSVGYASAPADTFELNRFLLRPVSLLGLGYMIAYRGGMEGRKRRLPLPRR